MESCYTRNCMSKFLVLFFLSLSVTSLFSHVYAAKPRIRKPVAKIAAASTTSAGYSKAKLSRATNSVVITFINLSSVEKITYTLSYSANGVEQGAMGSLVPNGTTTDSRDLYFGTCSHGVCTPHRNITGATLTIETKRKSGTTNVKRYKIKI